MASARATPRLPSGVASVLDAFRDAHDATVRVRLAGAGATRPTQTTGATDAPDGTGAADATHEAHPSDALLYPSDPTLAAHEGVVHRRRIDTGLRPIELEVSGAEPAAVEVLASAVAELLRADREAQAAAGELAERYEEINLLYTISEILGSILSLERASERILAEVADVLAARRASLWVHHPDDGRLHLTAAVGEEGRTGPIPKDEPTSVTAWVFRERRALNLERGSDLPPGIRMDLRPRRREAFLSVPINYISPEGTSRTVGVVTLVGRRSDASFDAGDARLLTAIASQVGAAIEIHRLFRESLVRDRMVHELELAHDLQLKLLPDTERFDGIGDVAARCVPAESVGGDFYHLFRLGDERLGVMIGDVSSHGFSAALIMAMAMSAASIYAPETGSPGDVLRRVHLTLIDELESTEMYMSIFYAVLDGPGRRLVYSNAGHPHAFRVDAEGAAERLGATNPPLGTVPLEAYDEAGIDWASRDDLLCLFTDGLSDSFAEGMRAGEARVVDAVSAMRDRAPAAILDRIFGMTGRTPSGAPPDDRTAVVVRI